jgi:hypothetical protein
MNVTSMSLREVRELIEEKNLGQQCMDAVDMVLGLGLSVAGPVRGGTSLPLPWPTVEAKDVVDALRAAVRELSKPEPGGNPDKYMERARRLAAANCLLVYTAYYDALRRLWPEITEKAGLSEPKAGTSLADVIAMGRQRAARETRAGAQALPVPRLAGDRGEDDQDRGQQYALLGRELDSVLERASGRVPTGNLGELLVLATEALPALADSLYLVEYLGLLADFGQFFQYAYLLERLTGSERFRWAEDLRPEAADRLAEITETHRARLAAASLATRRLDVGLQDLRAAVESLADVAPPADTAPRIQELASRLRLVYRRRLDHPVIAGQFEPDDVGQLSFPRKVDSFIPQAYRVAFCDRFDIHLELEETWQQRPVEEDIGAYLLRYLESPYSIEAPLLILGQPGSGKSMLTEVIAGSLAYPPYTAIRVRLRDFDLGKSLMTQLEDQIYADGGGLRVDWGDFAKALDGTPPLVILDGYDELLQATGHAYASFLEEVRQLQEIQALNGQPMRVIVTSRVTLIDKVAIPRGTTAIRLEEFDQARQARWTEVWNRENASYFQRAELRPFRLPFDPRIADLARQPLLLLMLAIYDSASNELSSQPNIDQTALYDRLLRKFIERELAKGLGGAAYRAARETSGEVAAEVDSELARLGVAAIGMVNRQDTKIVAADLDRDLSFFQSQRPGMPTVGALRQADMLLGSFFFIRKSAIGSALGAFPDSVTMTYEFLHNTFGEFLAADFILRQLLVELETIHALSANPAMDRVLVDRLHRPEAAWLGCLLHTPLFTRPVILHMIREWSRHHMGSADDRAALLAAFDQLVMAHLRIALNDLAVPAARESRPSPYAEAPVRGKVAIYTVNLLLLRAHVGGEYLLEEEWLDAGRPACGSWDGLTHLWRSWFPLESLRGLADVFTARRQDAGILILPVSLRYLWEGDRVALSWSVARALADDVPAAMAGLHLAAQQGMTSEEFGYLRAEISKHAPELSETAEILRRKSFPAEVAGTLLAPRDAARRVPRNHLDRLELEARLKRTPRQWLAGETGAVAGLNVLASSRYSAEAAAESYARLDPGLISTLLSEPFMDGEPGRPGLGMTWRLFCAEEGAAPVLRWAVRELDHRQCAAIMMDASTALLGERPADVADIDAASALAVLADRGGAGELRNWLLAMIIDECRTGTWSLLDIPVETWEQLADMFVSGSPAGGERRAEFIGILEAAIADSMTALRQNPDIGTARWPLAFFWIQALRIGATGQSSGRRDVLAALVEAEIFGGAGKRRTSWYRKCLLAVAGWARERGDAGFPMDALMPAELRRSLILAVGLPDGDTTFNGLEEAVVSRRLTYKEAQDIRWVLTRVDAR